MRAAILVLALAPLAAAQEWRPLFNGRNLEGWEPRGDATWHVMRDGTLLGQKSPRAAFPKEWPLEQKRFGDWLNTQAWLYTVKEFDEFDLELEYWVRGEGNSGVSIRDTSRAAHAITTPADFTRTPSKIGYEIQINNGYPDPKPTGSIYTFVDAKPGAQAANEWNTLRIESRRDAIRVFVNGQPVAEHPGDPARSKTGPIGLQLHDQFSVAMFRNIRIRELTGKR